MSTTLVNSRKTRVLGKTSAGLTIFAISGSEETEEERKRREAAEKSGEGGDGKSSEDKGGEGGSSADGASTDDKNGTREDNYPGESEADKWRRRAEAADRSKGETERELNKLKDKDRTELERATSKIQEQELQIRDLTERYHNTLIESEILKFPGYKWQDPDILLKLIDRESVQIDKEGAITGVKDAIQKIAKDKPFLLATESTEDKGKQNGTAGTKQQGGPGPQGQQQASGGNPTNGKPDDKNAQREHLANKYKLGSYM